MYPSDSAYTLSDFIFRGVLMPFKYTSNNMAIFVAYCIKGQDAYIIDGATFCAVRITGIIHH